MRAFILVSVLAAALSSCIVNKSGFASSASLGDALLEKPVGTGSGASSATYILGFIGPFGDDSLEAAVKDATGNDSTESMVNVFVDRKITVYPFFFLPIVRVDSTNIYGTVVQYSLDEE